MKTIVKQFLPVFLFITTLVNVQAAQNPVLRDDARAIIHRTVPVIIEAQNDVARGRIYTGDLSAAIAHQHMAVRLFKEGQYERSIHQCMFARNYAFAAIRANKAEIRAEWQFDQREQGYAGRAPAKADLDGEVRTRGIDVDLKDNRAAITHYNDLDVEAEVRPAPVQAPPPPPPPPQNLREDAKIIIHRTVPVIIEAQNDVASGRVYTGDLSAAIAHQHMAVRLYREGEYERSIHQCMFARNCAFAAIRANNAVVRDEWQFDQREQGYAGRAHAKDDMEAEVRSLGIDVGLKDDRAAVTHYDDLDIDVPVQSAPVQTPPPPPPPPPQNLREDDKIIIHRTVPVIIEAQNDVARGRVYTGDLSAAIAHQHMAVRLYREGEYERSIHQCMFARNCAFAAIRANNAVVRDEWQFDQREQGYAGRAPAKADLEGEVRSLGIDVDLKDDRAAVTHYDDLDVEVEARPAPVQPTPPPPPPPPAPNLREDAKIIIHRSVPVIVEAQNDVTRGRIYTGDLSAAIAHQHMAVRLYREGQYERAIHQCMFARNYAFAAIRANKAVIKAEWQFDQREQGYAGRAPAKEDLDGEVRSKGIDTDLKDDRAATTHYNDLDIDTNVR